MLNLSLRTIIAIVCTLICFSIEASSRYALVIGNANYQLGPLANPSKDAKDIAAALKILNFEVDELIDADIGEMEDAIYAFTKKLETGGIGLFYFAGHGVQYEGENFLMPIGATIERERQIKREALSVNELLGAIQDAALKDGRSQNNLNIVILDACRNNPYKSSFRSATRGLARVRPASGVLVAYSTTPGDVALDGEPGKNSVYTKHLLREIVKPDIDIEKVFKRVRNAVQSDTNMQQIPMESSMLIGDLILNSTKNNAHKTSTYSNVESNKKDKTPEEAISQTKDNQTKNKPVNKDNKVIELITPIF